MSADSSKATLMALGELLDCQGTHARTARELSARKGNVRGYRFEVDDYQREYQWRANKFGQNEQVYALLNSYKSHGLLDGINAREFLLGTVILATKCEDSKGPGEEHQGHSTAELRKQSVPGEHDSPAAALIRSNFRAILEWLEQKLDVKSLSKRAQMELTAEWFTVCAGRGSTLFMELMSHIKAIECAPEPFNPADACIAHYYTTTFADGKGFQKEPRKFLTDTFIPHAIAFQSLFHVTGRKKFHMNEVYVLQMLPFCEWRTAATLAMMLFSSAPEPEQKAAKKPLEKFLRQLQALVVYHALSSKPAQKRREQHGLLVKHLKDCAAKKMAAPPNKTVPAAVCLADASQGMWGAMQLESEDATKDAKAVLAKELVTAKLYGTARKEWLHTIGNLDLVDSGLNSSMGNKSLSEKQKRRHAADPHAPVLKADRAGVWTLSDIRARAERLVTKLAHQSVWDISSIHVPSASSQAGQPVRLASASTTAQAEVQEAVESNLAGPNNANAEADERSEEGSTSQAAFTLPPEQEDFICEEVKEVLGRKDVIWLPPDLAERMLARRLEDTVAAFNYEVTGIDYNVRVAEQKKEAQLRLKGSVSKKLQQQLADENRSSMTVQQLKEQRLNEQQQQLIAHQRKVQMLEKQLKEQQLKVQQLKEKQEQLMGQQLKVQKLEKQLKEQQLERWLSESEDWDKKWHRSWYSWNPKHGAKVSFEEHVKGWQLVYKLVEALTRAPAMLRASCPGLD
ncbi:hypothetical protein WJX73_003741 [Symbiochloris irregularis]|uniref:GmrSD restriction endonucleases C-terminal domain-containing protein n=1 Tax=Symbiochloris irregularis TaxID=706552 RepID=A0AAW1NWK5_9CHLO